MANVRDSLQALNAYPVPQRTFEAIAGGRGLDLDAEMTPSMARDATFLLAKADVMKWLANAPNVSQGGQSYSLSQDQRKRFLAEAQALYDAVGEPADQVSQIYGYKGSRL